MDIKAYINSKKKGYWLAVVLGLVLGVFYAYRTGIQDKKHLLGYGAIGAIVICLAYKALWGDKAEVSLEVEN